MTEIPATRRSDFCARLRAGLTGQRVVMRESGLFPWWSVAGLGLVSMLLGAVVLLRPAGTVRVMAVLAGIWLVVTGLIRVHKAFVAEERRPAVSATVGGVLVVVGVACLRDLAMAVTLLAVVVATAWLLSGIGGAVMAVKASGGMRILLTATAVVSVVAGSVFLSVPRLSLFTLVVTTGIGLLLSGAVQVVVGLGFRRGS